ncbi:MAG: NAD(P)-dependent alcohol dehydrogenase [Chloroflexota bacterium]
MKAARLHAYGELPVVEEIAEPVVAGPFDVVVRVGGAGLCRTDLHVVDGVFAYLSKALPYVLGHETAGWVHEVGAGVIDFQPGDPVILHPYVTCGFCPGCRRGEDQFCERFKFMGAMVDGGFAEFVATTARSLVKLGPLAVPAEVVGLADGGLAAYRAVKRSVTSLPPGSVVVVIGAGGLGHIAIQALRAMTPAEVVAVDRSAEALALARTVGAHRVILADGTHVKAVRETTGGRGADVVLDFVGDGTTPGDALGMLAPRGTYVVVGYGGKLEVPTADLVVGEVSIVGSLIGTHAELVELVALAERSLVTVTTRTYPLDAIGDAMEDLRQGRIQGRAVILP